MKAPRLPALQRVQQEIGKRRLKLQVLRLTVHQHFALVEGQNDTHSSAHGRILQLLRG